MSHRRSREWEDRWEFRKIIFPSGLIPIRYGPYGDNEVRIDFSLLSLVLSYGVHH